MIISRETNMYDPDCPEENSKRPEKGKSLLELPEDYVVVDLETTGLRPEIDEIIEIGAVRVRGFEITDTFSTLVYPANGIDPFITQLTGITAEMLENAPRITEALSQFLRFVDNDIVVGHNVHFDINFIYDKCIEWFGFGFSNDFIDTKRMSRKLFPEYRHHRLCDLEERFGLRNGQAHRALSDVMLTNDCYLYMRNIQRQKNQMDLRIRCLDACI